MDDVVKPETYWIQDRCYRKNPSRNNHQLPPQYSEEYDAPERDTQQQHKKTYDELEDEACGLDMSDDDGEGSNYVVEQVGSTYKTQCSDISSGLYNVIIGTKGSTKKRLETETNTKIIVPRMHEKGDIVIRGAKKRDVLTARRRIDLLCSQARFRRDVTHFLCYPLNKPHVITKYIDFRDKILQDFGSTGIDEGLFQTPERLHLTISVQVLMDARERTEFTNAVTNLGADVKNIVGNKVHKIKLQGLQIMNDDPTAVDVLYVKCCLEDDTLQNLANFVAKKLDSTGYCKKNRSDNIKLHGTLMNTRWRAESDAPKDAPKSGGWRNKNQRVTFDARDILEKYGDFYFGTVDIESIDVATIHSYDSDGSYKKLSTLSLI